MKIALGADHAGYAFKTVLAAKLASLGHDVKDFGTGSTESTDYPDYAIPVARAVASGAVDRGILACTNGIGMAMAANRIRGVRAALVYSARTAAMTRQHHDSNVLCLGAAEFPHDELLAWTRTWLTTGFEAGRHARRVGKFEALDRT